MTFRDARLLAAAAPATALVRLALWALPFRTVRNAVARVAAPANITVTRPPLDRIVWSIHVAARFIPRASCLTQSLTAQILLVRYGYPAVVRLGVARDAGQFEAHAWVESDGRVVIGEADLHRYTPMVAD
jgi:hypothetical protein